MRLSFAALAVSVALLPACELVASFDRDRIPLPELKRPDASLVVKPAPRETDGGPGDAAVGDAAVPPDPRLDGGPTMDATVPDAAVGPDGSIAADGGPADSGPRDQ